MTQQCIEPGRSARDTRFFLLRASAGASCHAVAPRRSSTCRKCRLHPSPSSNLRAIIAVPPSPECCARRSRAGGARRPVEGRNVRRTAGRCEPGGPKCPSSQVSPGRSQAPVLLSHASHGRKCLRRSETRRASEGIGRPEERRRPRKCGVTYLIVARFRIRVGSPIEAFRTSGRNAARATVLCAHW
jgi:hypothetical protein